MKKIILSLSLALGAIVSLAQTDVTLRINHKLGASDFQYSQTATNYEGQEFQVTRLEYYVSQITIVHDGGMETSVPLTVIDLVRPGTELSTDIALGNYAVTNLESVKFYIGVQEPTNNEDPSLYASGHPLAPQSPSMHWGWTSGYRFIAYEGYGSTGFTQNFQFHGLGNENYFEVATNINVVDESGTLVMNVTGDYELGLKGIDAAAGITSHGTTGEAKTVLENWRDFVFGSYVLGLDSNPITDKISVFPNPSTGQVTLNLTDVKDASLISIVNPLGAVVKTINVTGTLNTTINLEAKGVYFFNVLKENGEMILTEKLIVE